MFFRDKDYIVSEQGVIFKVKSYVHPPDCVRAFPRFLPFEKIPLIFWGQTWQIRGREYSRFDLRVVSNEDIISTYASFQQNYPELVQTDPYLGEITCVPNRYIEEHLTPNSALKHLIETGPSDDLQEAALRFAELCNKLGVSNNDMGITDSMIFDAHTVGFSDIDFVVYGGTNFLKLYTYLKSKDCDASITFPTLSEWATSYEQTQVKDMPLSPSVYARHKARKFEQGMIDQQKISIFAVRSVQEMYERYGLLVEDLGPLEIRGHVVNAAESMFRPSVYYVAVETVVRGQHLEIPNPLRIVNHRREYIFHVFEGEQVSAFGLAQRLGDEVILTLGSLEMRGRDYLVAQALCD